MKIEARWQNSTENWAIIKPYPSIVRWLFDKPPYDILGYVDAPKGAHFNTIADEYRKKYRKLQGEFKW